MRLQVLTLKPCRQSNSSLQRSTKVKFKESNWDANSQWNQSTGLLGVLKKPFLKLMNALKHSYGSKKQDWKHRIETWTLACFGKGNLMISHIRHTNIYAHYSGYPWKKLQGCSQAVALPMAPPSPHSRAPGNSADASVPGPQQPVSPAVECVVSPGRTNTRKPFAHSSKTFVIPWLGDYYGFAAAQPAGAFLTTEVFTGSGNSLPALGSGSLISLVKQLCQINMFYKNWCSFNAEVPQPLQMLSSSQPL